MTENLQVFKSIAEVMAELSEIGISKDRRNEQQKYKFRGIDDIYNTLSGLLSKHKICIIPYCQNRQSVERVTKSGGVSFYTTVTVKYDIISAIDGLKLRFLSSEFLHEYFKARFDLKTTTKLSTAEFMNYTDSIQNLMLEQTFGHYDPIYPEERFQEF